MYFPSLDPVLFGLIFALFPIASVITFYSHRFPVKFKKVVDWIGGIFMLVFMFSFVFWLIYDVGRLILRCFGINSTLFGKYGGFAVAILTAALIIPGFIRYLKVRVVRYKVDLCHDIGGNLNAVLISDVHLGAVNSERHLRKIVRIINEQDPDVVFIAGDTFNNNFFAITDPESTSALLRSIKSRYGVYACLGNHDAGNTYHYMADFLEKSGIKLLNDESVDVAGRFTVLGRIDPEPMCGFDEDTVRCDIKTIEEKMSFDLPVIVLDHNPSKIREYDSKYDLILGGHTHHGQMFPGNLFTHMLFKVDYGYYRERSDLPAVIVSSGAGVWAMPYRTASACEVVVIDIK